ncbi:hypothetical protein AYO41_05600 [Verrucomicrobia bacterium SCGC AG-212-E04]|nr:hypothetical protein AYO41_05600 [Verrucomicrobia bacterium SCGC AG-212-E04]
MKSSLGNSSHGDLASLTSVALIVLLLHVLTNHNYGFHRDELATLDDARALAWGYVAYPPVTPAIGRVALELFGNSLGGFRFFAALAASFIIFSINFWAHFIPVPPPPDGPGTAFFGVLIASGYLTAVKVIELLGGLLVLSGRFTLLGLLLLGPIIVNILFFDMFLVKAFNPVSAFAALLALFLVWANRDRVAILLKP